MGGFGDPFIGSYLPGGTARAPDDDPSMNSIFGGSRLLKASRSFAGLYCRESSEVCCVEKAAGSGDASIILSKLGRGATDEARNIERAVV